ncbi:MAG: LCP family protein [Eubacterium sp.]
MNEATQKTFEGNTTIALFGWTIGVPGIYDRGNSDVIMIVNVNNDTKKLQVVSVYRDTFLNIQNSDGSFHKANAAYAYGEGRNRRFPC